MNFENNKPLFASAKLNESAKPPEVVNYLAIILAGGSGLPGSGLIPARLRGQRPAYFSRTTGNEIVLNRARKQIEKVFSPEKTMFVVTDQHARYYEEVLRDVPPENLIAQPQDDGTTTAILYAALRLAIKNPLAILAFFPPDFYAPSAEEFMSRIESACVFARREPNLILLGIQPDYAKTEKEWIELDPTTPVDKNINIWRVRRLLTNPTLSQARELLNNGALLNSSVMVGTPATFLRKIKRAAPDIYEKFSLAAERIGTASEQEAVRAAYYSQYAYTDFSRDVLEKSVDKLMVAPVPALLKSAVGIETQAAASLSKTIVNFDP